MKVQMKWAEGADRSLGLPMYQTSGAAGADLRVNFADKGTIELAVGVRVLLPTGLSMAIEQGFEVQIRPRSGLALKHGITLVNAPGTIDADYRGLVGVILINLGDAPFTITHGDRIAQLVVAPVVQADFMEVDQLDDTDRATGGFGSTGSA
jgi:dUTP pyrophosphatase